jgi:lipoyl-dependent peroxiredoxin
MPAVRRAHASWEGNLADGSGTTSATTSRVFKDLPVSWKARTEGGEALTSPEELVAAAHSSCYAMAFSHELAQAGTPPTSLEVDCAVTFEHVEGEGFRVTSSALKVRGVVPGISEAEFLRLAEAAKNGCPISKAITGNVALSVAATLEA